MKFYSIDKLKKEDTKDGFYDLTTPTFRVQKDINVFSYIVPVYESGRIDLVCHSIYGNTDNCDFLLELNNIIDPFNVFEGDVIIYVEQTAIENFRPIDDTLKDVQQDLVNLNKKRKKDQNRANETPSAPITINEKKIDPIILLGDKVIIGKGLFNV
jgi:hypothetical protein